MALGKKTGGRKPGSLNKVTAARVEEARALGMLPHEVMAARARAYYQREMAMRAAAQDPAIDPELQQSYLKEADRLGIDGHVFCRDAAPYYAPRLSAVRVGGDANAGPLKIELVQFSQGDCLPVRPKG